MSCRENKEMRFEKKAPTFLSCGMDSFIPDVLK